MVDVAMLSMSLDLSRSRADGVTVAAKDATLTRDGTTVPLGNGKYVERGDVIRTGEKGVVRAVMSDDSTLMFAADTEYPVPSPEARNPFARAAAKAARDATDAIIQLNPDGYKATLPRGDIGSRG